MSITIKKIEVKEYEHLIPSLLQWRCTRCHKDWKFGNIYAIIEHIKQQHQKVKQKVRHI